MSHTIHTINTIRLFSNGNTIQQVLKKLETDLPIDFSISESPMATLKEAKSDAIDLWLKLTKSEWKTVLEEYIKPQVEWSLQYLSDAAIDNSYKKVTQKTKEWLRMRKPTVVFGFWNEQKDFRMVFWQMSRASASICEDMAGFNNYTITEEFLNNLITPKDLSDNKYVMWGDVKEDDARNVYVKRLLMIHFGWDLTKVKIEVFVGGLYINKKEAWIGVSDDGIVIVTCLETGKILAMYLIEIKCPGAGEVEKLYKRIPSGYECQIQLIMKIRGLDQADFIVWNPWSCYIQRRYADGGFAIKLINAMRTFWFSTYLQRSLECELGVANWEKDE